MLRNRVKEFVQEKILAGEKNPAKFQQRFYPSRQKLENIIMMAKMEVRFSKIDQENITLPKDCWSKWG